MAKASTTTTKPKAGAPSKGPEKYLIDDPYNHHITYSDYLESPAKAFLYYACDVGNASKKVNNKFSVKKDGNLNKNATINEHHINTALLPALMGHFETFQRVFFARMFDFSVYLNGFDVKLLEKFAKDNLKNNGLDFIKASGYRLKEASIGLLVADSMHGWHSPEKVNEFYRLFIHGDFYDKDSTEFLEILWQFRHSIVHTGGTLTPPDAQKVKSLNGLGEKRILFDENFISEIVRKYHKIIKQSVDGTKTKYIGKLVSSVMDSEKEQINLLFTVDSRNKSWL
jgi:hypothetical protein